MARTPRLRCLGRLLARVVRKAPTPIAAVVIAGVVAGLPRDAAAITASATQLTPSNPQTPNFLWISSEDNGIQLGVYGDELATTPNLDSLGRAGMVYRYAWSNAPVCAPARTAIISGLYPTSTGSHHMRSTANLRSGQHFLPYSLREAGYYTSNNAKEDYNLRTADKGWSDSSRNAHWRNRPAGTPFFSVFNIGVSHESQIRKRPHDAQLDPARIEVPPYQPDTRETRTDWAQYYDKVSEMDALAGQRLAELEADGLSETTIVVYFGDHGPGMPRGKRWPGDFGLRVPLIVFVPEAYRDLAGPSYRAGTTSDRLVEFVDLAPTLLSLAGIAPPEHYQGAAFLGPHEKTPREYLHGFRGRMDERHDLVRSARDQRYVYLRNFHPHRPHGQFVWYQFETPTTRVWFEQFEQGSLNTAQRRFFELRESEELYDLEADPHETVNLAALPQHRQVVERFRAEVRRHALETRDIGIGPEAEMHRLQPDGELWRLGLRPELLETRYDLAEVASRRTQDPVDLEQLSQALHSPDAVQRYWAALGHLVRGPDVVRQHEVLLRRLLLDPSPSVRIAAAEPLARYGSDRSAQGALTVLFELADAKRLDQLFVAVEALNSLDALDPMRFPDLAERASVLGGELEGIDRRYATYLPRLIERLRAR